MIHKLLFLNPELHEGLNITVRRGDKWYNNSKVGDTVEICNTNSPETVVFSSKIVGLAYIPFTLIPETWYQMEHDPDCITYRGLLAAMESSYPGFKNSEMVTVIIFRVV